MRKFAFGLYLAFMCSWFLHLPARLPALGVARVDLLLVCIMTMLIVVSSSDAPEGSDDSPTSRFVKILLVYAVVSVPLVEWPGSVARLGLPQFIKALVFFFFTVAFVTTPKRLRWTLVVFMGCQLFRVLEPVYLHVTTGYWGDQASMADWEMLDRLSGAPSDVVNPNGLAFIVLTVLPFLHYCTRSVAGRILYLAAAPALVYALVLTGSRSGMMGLAAIAVLIWVRSQHKVLLSVVLVALVAVSVPYLPEDLADRYLSIVSSNTKNAATAEGRTASVGRDFGVAMRRPLFGHGLGTSREANFNFAGIDKPSHNLYTEVLEEIGAVGLVIFLLFLRAVLSALGRAAKVVRDAPGAAVVVRDVIPALQVWIGMNILFSFASYGLSGYEWYLTAGLAEAAVRLAGHVEAAAPARPVAVPAISSFRTFPVESRS